MSRFGAHFQFLAHLAQSFWDDPLSVVRRRRRRRPSCVVRRQQFT